MALLWAFFFSEAKCFCLFDLILYVHSTIFQLCGTVLPGLMRQNVKLSSFGRGKHGEGGGRGRGKSWLALSDVVKIFFVFKNLAAILLSAMQAFEQFWLRATLVWCCFEIRPEVKEEENDVSSNGWHYLMAHSF